MSLLSAMRSLVAGRFAFRWGLLVMGLYALPYLLLGQDAYLTIHDFLDDSSYNFRPLILSGQAFDFSQTAVLPNVMNGLPRYVMHSGLNYEVWLFAVLPPFWAFLTNLIFVHLAGYAGMYLLLRRYVLPLTNQRWLAVLIALSFALIPTYTNLGLSVMGQPWILYPFLNVTNRRYRWTDALVIGLFPFFTFLVRSGLSLLIVLTILGLVNVVVKRSEGQRIHWPYWIALLISACLYGLSDFPMIYAYLSGEFVPHRVEFHYANTSVPTSFQETLHAFGLGQYHAGLSPTLVPLVLWVITLRRWAQPVVKFTTSLVGLGLLICLLHGFYPYWLQRLGQMGFLLRAFQLDRFYFLLPILWCLVTTLSAKLLTGQRWLLVVQIGLTLAFSTEWLTNVRLVAGIPVRADKVPYRAFFAKRLFDSVKEYIGKPAASYRVVSIGIHPVVAQHNGFYTLDSYQNNYPLAYKHQFRSLIAGELAKNETIRTYFDDWGSRCYMATAELGFDGLVGENSRKHLTSWTFDTQKFRSMGGRYVLSAVLLPSPAKTRLKFLNALGDRASYWRVYLYEVDLMAK
jgi:hypothetical protein